MTRRHYGLALFLFTAAPVVATAQPRDSIVSVSANRTFRAAPDRATMFVLVEGVAETSADAIARAEMKMKGVTDLLRSMGTRVMFERPTIYGVGPSAPPGGYPPPQTTTNTARATVRVTTTQPDQVAQLVAALVGAGATSTSTLTFELSTIDSLRRSRIAEVVSMARGDGEALAAALGGRLGAIVSVSTSISQNFNQTYLNFDNRGGQNIAPEIQVNANVSITFRLLR